MKKILIASALGFMIFSISFAEAHSGGTDSRGCHYDHKNGGYHCHH